jgi:hypothetical protein
MEEPLYIIGYFAALPFHRSVIGLPAALLANPIDPSLDPALFPHGRLNSEPLASSATLDETSHEKRLHGHYLPSFALRISDSGIVDLNLAVSW